MERKSEAETPTCIVSVPFASVSALYDRPLVFFSLFDTVAITSLRFHSCFSAPSVKRFWKTTTMQLAVQREQTSLFALVMVCNKCDFPTHCELGGDLLQTVRDCCKPLGLCARPLNLQIVHFVTTAASHDVYTERDRFQSMQSIYVLAYLCAIR